MAATDLLQLESFFESGFEMDIDETDCSGPLAMSGRCSCHEGLRIEISEHPHSMRKVANIIVALQRLQKFQKVQSTEFTEKELFNIIMENVIEENVMMKAFSSNTYNKQDKVVQCTMCDNLQKRLVQSSNPPILLAVTLNAANISRSVSMNLSAYTSPNYTSTVGQPVCLGIAQSNLYIACSDVSGTPQLILEEVNDKETLKTINMKDDMEKFLFYRKVTGDTINTFESVKFRGWFISTSNEEKKRVDMCTATDNSRQKVFTLQDQKEILNSATTDSNPHLDSVNTEMAETDLLKLESFFESDDEMGFDEMDCSDSFAMSGRCACHEGLRIEISEQPHSMRKVVNIVIALQRLQKFQKIQSTDFTDNDLLNVIMENLIEESVVIKLHHTSSRTYKKQDKIVQCTICDNLKKKLVRNPINGKLLAITLRGGSSSRSVSMNLSAYTTPSYTSTDGQPVCLGIAQSNLYLACSNVSGTPQLILEAMNDKETLKSIIEADDMERFLFFRKVTGNSINTFESVKHPGWFISTSNEEYKQVDMCTAKDSSRQKVFTLLDQKII
ncbi:uncharacterized protein [Hoplias malabaricus]|uniref:uncharacterized protein n=1 Tax=Hoplias malabaricus TaxID=27720 RepID=UPI003462101E